MFNELADAVIKKVENRWCIFSEDGSKRLGCFDSKDKALKRLRQIEHFKKAREESTGGDDHFELLIECFMSDAEVDIVGSYGFGVSEDETSPIIYYLSDGSIYLESGGSIVEIEDPMLGFLDEETAEELCKEETEEIV